MSVDFNLYSKQNRINCCYKCTKRALGCHGQCDDYNRQKVEYEADKAKRKEHDKEGYLNQVHLNDYTGTARNGINYRKKLIKTKDV